MPYKNKAAQRAYQTKWLQNRRNSWIEQQDGCATCGDQDGPFDVDHIDRDTKVDHRVWSWSESRRSVELAKCQVLCVPCHATKSGDETRERYGELEHGTRRMYIRYDCRCELCKDWLVQYWRKRRAS